MMSKMNKVLAVTVATFAIVSSMAGATPLTVYDGKHAPKGTQIFLLSPSAVQAAGGYHVAGPMERYQMRRDAKRRRALAAAEQRLREQELSEVETVREEIPAPAPHVAEALSKPNPVVNGVKMGRFAAREALQPKAEAPAPVLKPVAVDAKSLPVYRAPKVRMPKGYYSFGTAESPFTAREILRMARRGVLGMRLSGNTVEILPRGNQYLWVTIEPAVMDRGEIGGLKGPYPVKYLAWDLADKPQRVRMLGGAITFRPEAVEMLLKDDVIGRSSDTDDVYRQAEVVEALRKRCRTDRAWGSILARAGVGVLNGLGIKLLTGSDDGRDVQVMLDFPKWEAFGMLGK